MFKFFAAFFAFGATMCALASFLLLFPGTGLDSLWSINPPAHAAFGAIGNTAFFIMFAVGLACALAAAGLWRKTIWGVPLALTILSLNIIGDLFNALVRHNYRALIGLPVGGAMIFHLARSRKAD